MKTLRALIETWDSDDKRTIYALTIADKRHRSTVVREIEANMYYGGEFSSEVLNEVARPATAEEIRTYVDRHSRLLSLKEVTDNEDAIWTLDALGKKAEKVFDAIAERTQAA